MKTVLTIFAVMFFASAAWSEAPASVAGVYRGSSGIETRTITLLTNGNYLARWDGDLGSNGTAAGSWKLIGKEVHLTPKKEDGSMMRGHFRVMLVRELEGKQALLRKEDEEFSANPLFHLFLQKKEPNQTSEPTAPSGRGSP